MLFDLRSKRRRGAVRVVYLFLALVMVAGLVLVGVGTGSNNGGLLNAFTNNSSTSGQNTAVDKEVNKALKRTKATPDSAAAWSDLLTARWTAAGTGSNYNSDTDEYTKGGKKQLEQAIDDWNRYVTLSNDKPSLQASYLAAGIFQIVGQWDNAATAWNYAADREGASSALKPLECMALNYYAAKKKTQGDLAAAQATKLAPKAQRLTLKETMKDAKKSATTAQETAAEDC